MRNYFKNFLTVIGMVLFTTTVFAIEEGSVKNKKQSLEMSRRMQCSIKDNETVYAQWSGNLYSRRQGERDKLLFKVVGLNTRKCITDTNAKKQRGYKLLSREIMLYLDPKTGKTLSNWKNPWTSEVVKVKHVANDPVNSANYGYDRRGKESILKYKDNGDGTLSMSYEIPLFYTNALGGKYQDYVGNKYHAMEIFNFFVRKKDLFGKKKSIPFQIAWVRISQWLPWMKMGSRPGLLIANATGHKVFNYKNVDSRLRKAVSKQYPKYKTAPKSSDRRKNETSWTVFKKYIDSQKK